MDRVSAKPSRTSPHTSNWSCPDAALPTRIPDELGINGVDNTEVASIAFPTLTTLDFDLDYSAEQMLRAIAGEAMEPAAASQVEARLRNVDRMSTALGVSEQSLT